MNVKIDFIYGDLDEQIYMVQPEGFSQPKQEHLVCKLGNHFIDWNNIWGSGTNDLTPTQSGFATKDVSMTFLFT